mmetsp:Transcript_9977/g.13173  ORF Transcript_9977/g.13173 Transcript_9977/m.13173 type:complete len:550 (-) Transcript_9977:126-1775(-)|eukprot:CAMPEP_0198154036 /NCGR_PEP_ID=MMETSP1443-20131203/66959_1 /TAXON_ID=186043 /ORGANISM="Entomoneis sp., Strain CCMP2396" /LENGTH=549 /DNA_ID=CAMNT_0043820609 /DNA_START=10 /DNA_END=1659 /DNA_ORIENTATION=-
MTDTANESKDLYQVCTAQEGDDASAVELLQCVTQQLAMATANSNDARLFQFQRSLFLILCAALAFFMQAGFAMVCAGAVRKKNVRNTMTKNLLDACGAAIAFFAVGYAFAFGGSKPESSEKTFIGTKNFFLVDEDDYAFFLFQYAFSAACATIVAGTLAERCQMSAYLCYSLMLTGWVYPVVAHSVWSPNGFLSAKSIDPLWGVGMIDFAGSGVVHVTGGVTALFATMILGPRRGRFHDESGALFDVPHEFPGHSQALQMLGTFVLWFGWYGFNCGTALLHESSETHNIAALAGVNTTLAAGMAGMTALFANMFVLERFTGEAFFDLKYLMNGTLCGLVSITAGCGVMEPWAATVTGCMAGFVYILGSRGLVRMKLDDAVDAIPVHMMSGILGVINVGLFASPRHLQSVYGHADHPGLFYTWRDGDSSARLLGVQLVGLLFILGWVMCLMLPFFVLLDWKGWFRSDPLDEVVGLDTSYHGGLFLWNNNDDDSSVHSEAIETLRKRRADHARSRLGAESLEAFRNYPQDAVTNTEGTPESDDDQQGGVQF